MEDKIIKMLNSITASDYYISNPYSSTCNKAFKKLFQSKDFLDFFYLLSNKTYERLAIIATVSEDSTKNTVFVTGFRGCGKTCFMNLLRSIVESEYVLPEFIKCKLDEQQMMMGILKEWQGEELEKVEKRYKQSADKLKTILQRQMRLKGMEINEQNYSVYLNLALKGKSVFLNFEKGNASNDELPFDKKFRLKIEDVIGNTIREKTETYEKNEIIENVINLYRKNINEFNNLFEKENTFLSFIKFCEKRLIKAENFSNEKEDLDKILSNMNLEQLLCILVLLYLGSEVTRYKDGEKIQKLFFILDNMDIVYRHNILEESMHEYSNFIENMNSLMEEIEKTEEHLWSELYERVTFVFAMRETTAMQIADHFIDGMEFVAKNFDISLDIDKALVVEKKYLYIKKYEKDIDDAILKRNIYRIHSICTDFYIKSNVFPMFNNDYKRAIACISAICEKNVKLMEQEENLLRVGTDYNKNGARGIIFRVIFDEFMARRYFEKIGIVKSTYHKQEFTVARIVLTLLYNLLPEYDGDSNEEERDRLSPETLSLKYLYELCRPIIIKKRFIDALTGMFELKKAPTWNHLITFDNIKKVSYQELDEYLTKVEKGEYDYNTDIELRITCAGSNYIKFICTHFEFFSCRYTRNTEPLFTERNAIYSEKYDEYNFEYVIRSVYNAVRECCTNLKPYNKRVSYLLESSGGVSFLESDYVFRDKEDNQGRLHEERLIHGHIRYIDNYRMHVIKDIYPDRVVEINKKIIKYIKMYITLLNEPLMSEMSGILNEQLSKCILFIEGKGYDDNVTQISRSSYKQLVKEGKINGIN